MKWFLGVILLLLAALILESGLLAYAMYVLLGLLVVSRILALTWMDKVWATRVCQTDEVKVGESVRVQVTVHNKGGLPVPWMLLEDMLPAKTETFIRNRVRVKRRRIKLALVPAKGFTELDYEIEFKSRGYYQIGPLVLETGDFFGLHRRYRVGTEPHYVLVYPRVVALEGYDLKSRRPIGEVRMSHRLYEDPTRISGVREYQAGDSLGRIHWRATARTGALHSKVYEPSSVAGATILLDFHPAGYPNSLEPQRSDFAVTTAVSIAFALYQVGQQIGFISNGRDASVRVRREGWQHDFRTRKAALASIEVEKEDDRLQPVVVETRRGVEQFQRIWETLARLELNDGLSFSQTLIETGSRLPRDATVIAVLARVTKRIAMTLGNLRRRGYAVVAVLVILNDEQLETAKGRLLAEGIESRYVSDEATLAAVCGREALL